MKKQTKKEVWYWLIIGVAILLLMTIFYGARLADKDITEDQTDKQEQAEEVEQEPINQDEKQTEESSEFGVGGNNQTSYSPNQSGGELGQSYLLDDINIIKGEEFDRLKIDLLPEDESQLPRWQANQKDKTIDLIISDTSNYDIVSGQKTYTGKSILTDSNNIRKATIDTSSGDQIIVKIETDIRRPYEIVKSTNPLSLVVRVY